MNANSRQVRPAVFIAMLGLAILFRLFPFLWTSAGYSLPESYPWGFSPMLPVCLFGAASLRSRTIAFLCPLVAWFAGDLALGLMIGGWGDAFYDGQAINYLAFATCIALGYWLRGHVNFATVAGLGLVTPVVFFLVSNFGTWAMSPIYAKTPVGLWESYLMGIPFLRYSLLSQIVFLPILFSPVALRRVRPVVCSEAVV